MKISEIEFANTKISKFVLISKSFKMKDEKRQAKQ